MNSHSRTAQTAVYVNIANYSKARDIAMGAPMFSRQSKADYLKNVSNDISFQS